MLQDKEEIKTFFDEAAEVIQNAWANRDQKGEQMRRTAIRDDLNQRNLPCDREAVEAIELEVEQRIQGPADTEYREGDEWTRSQGTSWIWDQWIAEGYCNVLVASQKVGKSTFVLCLVAELLKRTGSFLNFSFSEKKEFGFVLVGPDMNRRLWTDYGEKAGLLKEKGNGKLAWESSIKTVYPEETSIGLDPSGIKKITADCKLIKEKGLHPFVICDSYSALVANSHPHLDENSANYTNPLRKLKQAMSKEGATLLMIHHSSISGSKRDTASSASGHQNWGRVPDQIITLKWLQAEVGPDGSRTDSRVVLSATGRTGSVAKAQLIEQSPNWGWSSHGDTSDALRHRHALEQRDKLMGDDAILYDLINVRTRNNKSSSIRDVMELHATTSRAPWNESKTRRLVKKLARKFLVHESEGPRVQPADFGGRPPMVYWTFERGEPDSVVAIDVHARPGTSVGTSVGVPSGVSCTSEPSAEEVPSVFCAFNGGTPKNSAPEPPRFHDTEDFPAEGVVIEDTEGQPFQVLEAKAGAQMLRVRDRHDRDAPVKERRWLMDVFPIGHKAKAEEDALYFSLIENERI